MESWRVAHAQELYLLLYSSLYSIEKLIMRIVLYRGRAGPKKQRTVPSSNYKARAVKLLTPKVTHSNSY